MPLRSCRTLSISYQSIHTVFWISHFLAKSHSRATEFEKPNSSALEGSGLIIRQNQSTNLVVLKDTVHIRHLYNKDFSLISESFETAGLYAWRTASQCRQHSITISRSRMSLPSHNLPLAETTKVQGNGRDSFDGTSDSSHYIDLR